jgi:hypothetical protein
MAPFDYYTSQINIRITRNTGTCNIGDVVMFGWLNKKAINEQKKLIWQTYTAAEACAGFYDAKGDVERAVVSKKISEYVHEISSVFDQDKLIDPKVMATLLEANKQARILYEGFPQNSLLGINRTPFDEKFVPSTGWETYFKFN